MAEQITPKKIRLSSEIETDQLGFGTWKLRGQIGQEAIESALNVGYRHIDTADFYRNHARVGAALQYSGISRNEVFIVTKIWSNNFAANKVGPAIERFLQELKSDYIDLLLMHWPAGKVPIAETLQAMEKSRELGKIRGVGVSNFGIKHLDEAKASGIEIVNNQIEFNLRTRPEEVLARCKADGISVTSYSSLERGNRTQEKLVEELGAKYEATREQVLLNWLMSKGMIVIPRSKNPAHIEANWAALKWKMNPSDTQKLDQAD